MKERLTLQNLRIHSLIGKVKILQAIAKKMGIYLSRNQLKI